MMLAFIFNGIYTYNAETLAPVFIRLAVLLICIAAIYDYVKRRWANAIIKAVVESGADSPETAKTADELDKVRPGVKKYCMVMLKDYSMLRRYVLKAGDESEEEKKSSRLTGDERFYIPKATETKEEGIEALKAAARRIPASLREGGEKSLFKMIVGLILLVIASELLVKFFPAIYAYIFENSKNIFG